MGALLRYIEEKRVGVELEDPATVPVPIMQIDVSQMKDLMLVSRNTYSALQIFRSESHPSAVKRGGQKEGLSLFGVLNRCKSRIGAKRLRSWFLQPLRNPVVLSSRQDAIEFLCTHPELLDDVRMSLARFTDAEKLISKMRKSEIDVREWFALSRMCEAAALIGSASTKALRSRSDKFSKNEVQPLTDISSTFAATFVQVGEAIKKICDFDASKAENRFIVKPFVHDKLDEMKRAYNELPALSKITKDVLLEMMHQ